MEAKIVKTQEEMDDLLNRCDIDRKSKFPGMSYEEGIRAVIYWLLGMDDIDPMED